VDNVAQMNRSDRADLFNETAARMELNPVIIEKDFWICWILKQLFTIKEFSGRLVFKGGTSLSKCFNLIQRFSEDIDIAVDFEKLGFFDKKDPHQTALSHTKRSDLLKEMLIACQNYIANEFLPVLNTRIENVLSSSNWRLDIDSVDGNIVEFTYPTSIETELDYIKPHVVVELGTHAEPVPNENYDIQPYAAEHFPNIFSQPKCSIATVVAKRTFWEKATILHAEFHRPFEKPMPLRYSRHYADVAVMGQTPIVNEALEDLDLLRKVTVHKNMFYHCGWARYDSALPCKFRLVPPQERIAEIRRDYRNMAAMFFNDPPIFDDILQQLSVLERRINRI
jgi:hypothetical protein